MRKNLLSLLGGIVLLFVGILWLLTDDAYLRFVGAPLIFGGGILISDGITGFWFKAILTREEGLKLFQELLARAEKEVIITSGSLDATAYVKYGRIKQIIEEKVKNKVRFHIICGPEPDQSTLQAYSSLSGHPNFTIYKSKRDPFPHGILIDGKGLRIEAPHQPSDTSRRNDYFRLPLISQVLFRKFVRRYENGATRMM